MTSAETILSDPRQPSVALCAILSVVIHVGLLAVMGVIPKPIPTNETLPVMQISLVPVQSKKPSLSPHQPPPSLRAVSRPVSAPLHSSSPASQLMTSHLKSVDSTLEPPVTRPAQELPPKSTNKKVVKDQQAADALVGRTLMKLSTSRSTPSQAHSSSQPVSHVSQVITPGPKTLNPALKSSSTPPTQEPSHNSTDRRVVKDQQAADALMGRTLMKMSTPSQGHSSAQASPPKLTIANNAAASSTAVGPSANDEETQAVSSLPTQRRVLTAGPPGGQSISGSKLSFVHFVPVLYPRVAREAGWEGTVIVGILVLSNGLPGEVTIKKSSGYPILDRAALQAARQWRFKPAKDGNIAINKYFEKALNFELSMARARGYSEDGNHQ